VRRRLCPSTSIGDIGYLCVVRSELQRGADAAALAGAGALVDSNGDYAPMDAQAVAVQYAQFNTAGGSQPDGTGGNTAFSLQLVR